MSEIKQIKVQYQTKNGSWRAEPALIEIKDGRIWFLKSPFAIKDDIKAMKGSKWHGFDEDPKKMWSVEDCERNRINLAFMAGGNPLEHFDKEVQHFECRQLTRNGKPAKLMPHQQDLIDTGLTFHYQIWGAEMGVGKTLSAQMVIEKSGATEWWWIGPKTSIPNIKREFKLFGFPSSINVEFMTYEGLTRRMDEYKPGDMVPQGMIVDESSRVKTDTAQRTKAAQKLADLIRQTYGYNGFVILMSGTPSPKTPVDWWSQCEIAWPGFLKEGSPKALEQRLAFLVKEEYATGSFFKRIGWRDDNAKCDVCGEHRGHDNHNGDLVDDPDDFHVFKPSTNEVAAMYERLKGLVTIKHKKDCLSLPDKRYRRVYCKPTASLLRVAQAVSQGAPNAITGMTLLRELSDGFQYREEEDGTTRCTHCNDGMVDEWYDPTDEERTYEAIDMMDESVTSKLEKRRVPCPVCDGSQTVAKRVRIAKELPCPKVDALKLLLEENSEVGRIVIFAGFTGSVDRVTGVCQAEGWDVVKCDGRGFYAVTHDGVQITEEQPLDYWADTEKHPRVAFVAHPESGGMSLTLTEARMAVYWSNSWKPEYRVQSEDRIHRVGMDLNKGCVIVDLIHLPSDERVLEVIRSNRKLELMTMGEVLGEINWDEPQGADLEFSEES